MTEHHNAENAEVEAAPCWGCVGKCSFCTVATSAQPIILCETTGACTCGAPATTPRGLHHDDCGVHIPPAPSGNPDSHEWLGMDR